jgi:hypothetical protein
MAANLKFYNQRKYIITNHVMLLLPPYSQVFSSIYFKSVSKSVNDVIIMRGVRKFLCHIFCIKNTNTSNICMIILCYSHYICLLFVFYSDEKQKLNHTYLWLFCVLPRIYQIKYSNCLSHYFTVNHICSNSTVGVRCNILPALDDL